jgi:hypothetical protein
MRDAKNRDFRVAAALGETSRSLSLNFILVRWPIRLAG